MKTLQEVLEYTPHHMPDADGGWAGIGAGAKWMTVSNLRQATNSPTETTDTDAGINIDQDWHDKLEAFFDVLGDIMMHDNSVQGSSIYDAAGATTKDHSRIADVRESLEISNLNESETLTAAFNIINEAVINQAGRLWEANVSFRGMSRMLKVFYPSMKSLTRRTLQEDLNKVFSGAVVLTFSPSKDTGRVNGSFIIMENAFVAEENVIFDGVNTVIVLEKACGSKMKPKAKKAEDEDSDDADDKPKKKTKKMVKELFDDYVANLAALEEERDDGTYKPQLIKKVAEKEVPANQAGLKQNNPPARTQAQLAAAIHGEGDAKTVNDAAAAAGKTGVKVAVRKQFYTPAERAADVISNQEKRLGQ